jgi:pimeloyl-ACP methyl ester carboxylesterase
MKHHVIYVPGLGDHRSRGQQMVVRWWRVFGVRSYCYVMNWGDKKPLRPKMEGLLRLVDELAQNGDKVSLIGTSAGASAVLIAYAQRPNKISGVVCICGKISHPETIHPLRYKFNPAFKESMSQLQDVLPKLDTQARARILSIHPLADESVPPVDTLLPGAQEKLVPTFGHAFSIGFTLVVKPRMMINFLKKQAAE